LNCILDQFLYNVKALLLSYSKILLFLVFLTNNKYIINYIYLFVFIFIRLRRL